MPDEKNKNSFISHSNKIIREEDLSTITSIQFGILSSDEILKRSVAHITESTLYDTNGEPRLGGLFDPRMGVIERGKKCKTCLQTYVNCPGHFGHIELAKPVFYVQFISQIIQVLKCVCIRCSKLLVNKNHPIIKNMMKYKKPEERLDYILNKMKNKTCGTSSTTPDELYNNHGCGAIQPSKILSQNLDYIVAEWTRDVETETSKKKEVSQQTFSPEIVFHIFKRISSEDSIVMGFSSVWCLPHWMICTILPIAPPSVRPSIKMYNNQRCEDDITHKYNDIVKHNNILKDKLSNVDIPEEQVKQYSYLIQYHIATLIDNSLKGVPPAGSRSGRPLKTFKERIHGKEGRIRGNLMGKRVDFSARSVISPDPSLDIDQLGVPMKIAMNLTYPDIVNKYNINKSYKVIRNGTLKYPGAKSYVSIDDGRVRSLEYIDTEKIILKYGDVIHRHLQDDDYVLFNRQPSLHKMSMMGHRVKVMQGQTFRLNVDVCEPYNADFDGDEMNMHVPQSIQTSLELRYLAAVPRQIISPSYNVPIIKPSQDNLLGLFKITGNDVFFTQKEMMNLMHSIDKFNGVLPEPFINNIQTGYIRWNGHQTISTILPNISYRKKHDNPDMDNLVIDKGVIISGRIDKGVSEAIVHIIFIEYGFDETKKYLNNLQKIISRYMTRSGFSVGMSDLMVHQDIQKRNEEYMNQAKKEVVNISKQVHLNIFENISKGIDVIFEAKILGILGKTSSKIEKETSQLLGLDNRLNFIVTSGSKGKANNISQMSCLLAQVMVDGKRIPLGFNNRTLPHYSQYDNGIESRGFVTNNFKDGLTPQEFFFHAMAGREGLIDTAVKTAKSGYLQRKLVKSTEDLKAHCDFTVRGSNNNIVQFIYGEDGFNSIYLQTQNFNKLFMINQETFENEYRLSGVANDWRKFLTTKEYSIYNRLLEDKKNANKVKEFNEKIIRNIDELNRIYTIYLPKKDTDGDITLYFPIHFKNTLNKVKQMFNLEGENRSDINPIEIIDELDKLHKECVINENTNLLFEFLIADYLSPNYLIKKVKITRIAFNYLTNFIKSRFFSSLVEGGEMVGPIAAQSIGEISTQLTLNTFHYAGVGEKSSVNQGVPRLDELISRSVNIKQPQLNIFLHEDYRYDLEKAEQVQYNIELVNIKDILISDAIYLEPTNNLDNVLDEDKDIMKIYEVFSELDEQFSSIKNNPWLIKLEFNRREMINKKITMEDVNLILKHYLPNASIIYADDNSSKLIFRLRMDFEMNNNTDDDIKLLQTQIEFIKNIIIKGVSGIDRVYRPKINKNNLVKVNDTFETRDEYFLETHGSNLFDIMTKPYIDQKRTFSININEMYQVFGIESARWTLENQLSDVFSRSGKVTSPRHLGILSDIMTSQGIIMPANRNGINQTDIGPLAKCSFEETAEQLKMASLFGQIDNLNGVSSNIMVGQIPKCGTGDSEIILDEDKLLNIVEQEISYKEEHSANAIFESSEYCEMNQEIGFDLSMIVGDNVTI
jgi:DNA-directed RNA polymerase II subunit RPB1